MPALHALHAVHPGLLGDLDWHQLVAIDPLVGGVVTGLLVLVAGGAFVHLEPETARRITDRARYTPVEAAIYGVGVNVGAVLGIVVLLILGLAVLAIPLAAVYLAISIVALVVGALSVARLVTGEWTAVVLVGAVIAGLANAIPIVGTAVSFALVVVGVGVLAVDRTRGYDREFVDDLAGPGTLRSRVGISTDDGDLEAFHLAVTYWTGESWEPLFELETESGAEGVLSVRSPDGDDDVDVDTEAVDSETVDDATRFESSLDRAFAYAESTIHEHVRTFEDRRGIDDTAENEYERPLADDDLERARETLAVQQETARTYLEELTSGPRRGWIADVR